MKRTIQGICALFAISALVAALPIDATQITPLAIENTPVQVEDRTIVLSQYSYNGTQFAQSQYLRLTTPVNLVSMGGDLTFTALEDETYLSISVLTDLNGDGYYEWLDDPLATFSLSLDGQLVASADGAFPLQAGEDYTISTTDLRNLGTQAEQARMANGSTPVSGLSLASSGDLIYCISTQSEEDGQTSYYFALDYTLDTTTDLTLLGAGVFSDVPSWAWYWSTVDWAVRQGLMTGEDATHYSPDTATTRAALMQVLYRQAGSPEVATTTFTDVLDGDWHQDAISWGYQLGLVSGYPNGSFGPDLSLTREELAVILYNVLGDDSAQDLTLYTDADTVASWSWDAMSWALAVGVLEETDGSLLSPQGTVSRASLSAVLYAMDGL